MSDIHRFLNENESLQPKMADYLGYASGLRYGDVLPLLLQACTALVFKMAASERFFSDSQSLGLGAYPTNRPVEAPTTPILGQESVHSHCDQPQLSGNQDSAKDRHSTTVDPPSSKQDPLEDQWAPDQFQGNWGYARLPYPTPTALNFISCSVANLQEVDLWADTPQFQEARVRSNQPEQDPTHPKRVVHRVQCGAPEDRNRRIKATALRKQHQSTQTNRLAVCQLKVDRVAEWTAAINPVNQDFKITTNVFGFGNLAGFHRHFGGSSKTFYSDGGVKPVWRHPTIKDWDRCITKVFADGAKGIAVVPVSNKDPWFWAIGECVIDWVDIPIGSPLLVNKKGTIVTTNLPYRICLFDAYGQEPSDTHTHTDSNPHASTLLVDASHSPTERDIPMPRFEELLSDSSSDTDSGQESGRGLNRRYRRLLRMVRKRQSE